MERMVINTTAMRNTASEFGTEISEWHGLVEQIWAAMSELDAMWDGDANTAFNTLIAEDKPKFTQLERMMEEYKNAITTAAGKYEAAEGEVKVIVTTRM